MKAKYELVLHPSRLRDLELEKVEGFPKSAPGDPDMPIIVGGDGTLLWDRHNGKKTKKLLLRKETSIGFYKALDLKDVDDGNFWGKLELGNYKTTSLPMLEVEVSSDRRKETYYAVNDVAIRGTTNDRLYEFEIVAHCGLLPESRDATAQIRAEGMIFSTSQASSAHNRSAGGSVNGRADCYVITAALAYTGPYSEVFDGKEETRIVAKGKMQIAIDGSNPFLDELERVELRIKLSEDKFVELVTFEDFNVLERAQALRHS